MIMIKAFVKGKIPELAILKVSHQVLPSYAKAFVAVTLIQYSKDSGVKFQANVGSFCATFIRRKN